MPWAKQQHGRAAAALWGPAGGGAPARARGQNLGVVSFVAAPMRLGPRDEHVGWDKPTRGRNLHRLMANDRLLIPPRVCVANLASHALGLALQHVAGDWLRQPRGRAAIWGMRSRKPSHAVTPWSPIALAHDLVDRGRIFFSTVAASRVRHQAHRRSQIRRPRSAVCVYIGSEKVQFGLR